MERVSKRNYYLDIAQTVLERATCLRRVYGAIIVKNDEIISTGYTHRRIRARFPFPMPRMLYRPNSFFLLRIRKELV